MLAATLQCSGKAMSKTNRQSGREDWGDGFLSKGVATNAVRREADSATQWDETKVTALSLRCTSSKHCRECSEMMVVGRSGALVVDGETLKMCDLNSFKRVAKIDAKK